MYRHFSHVGSIRAYVVFSRALSGSESLLLGSHSDKCCIVASVRAVVVITRPFVGQIYYYSVKFVSWSRS